MFDSVSEAPFDNPSMYKVLEMFVESQKTRCTLQLRSTLTKTVPHTPFCSKKKWQITVPGFWSALAYLRFAAVCVAVGQKMEKNALEIVMKAALIGEFQFCVCSGGC